MELNSSYASKKFQIIRDGLLPKLRKGLTYYVWKLKKKKPYVEMIKGVAHHN